MKRNLWHSICLFIFLTCVQPPSANAVDSIVSEVLHPALGETIDSLENVSYNIFGRIPGFTAAHLYRVEDRLYRLDLIRNTQDRAQLLILDLSPIEIDGMRNRLAGRVRDLDNGKQPSSNPVFEIDEAKWAEKYQTKKVVLQDGSEILGMFIRTGCDTLTVKTLGGLLIPIPEIGIMHVTEIRREVDRGQWIRPDPNQSRLFFAPTGRPLKGGSGYFADYYIFFPTLALGITDFFSISGGFSLIPGAHSQLLYLAPKITITMLPRVGFSTGFLTMKVPGEEGFTLCYAVTTMGSEKNGITLGAGVPVNHDSDRKAILLIGGESQISNSAKLITENWIFTGGDGFSLFSGGIRFFGDKLAVDLALITTPEAFKGEGFPFLPYVSFAVFFGK